MEFDKTQDLLNRMRYAHSKGRGIRISAEELKELHLTFLGEMWEQPDPRHLTKKSSGQEKSVIVNHPPLCSKCMKCHHHGAPCR